MYYVYVIQLHDATYYHGFSRNLRERLKEHQEGSVYSTKNLRPFKLVFYSAFFSKKKALAFEKYLKSSSGFAFRNKHLI
ncbi:MAG: excinuclease ABC subunit C [Candidatus Levybacteria bacterium RIFCSPLOWO2_12_FULL_37_14]|nr:MAG: excinuclease ABC subunit C [Candidatus Levybacteria bacterium RIFCSPLOWO2_12_FULL_37_14]